MRPLLRPCWQGGSLRHVPWLAALPALLVGLGAGARADVELPALFTDHMVLQREIPVPVWGWAEPGEAVTVTLGEQSKPAKADGKGKWSVKLAPLKAGGPLILTVRGKNTLTIRDVLIGEVWLCSGQSNMAMTVQRSQDAEQEKAAANLPQLRMFVERSGPAPQPREKCSGQWQVCSPQTVSGFSATAYFFGRMVHKVLGVPVGLINSSVGGTPIEAWTSLEAQQARPELKLALNPPKPAATPKNPANRVPGHLFNGKIAPLIPYALRGMLWYQGENNANSGRGTLYRVQLPVLIEDWRARWGQGDVPFAWVQLPNFRQRGDDPNAPSDWAVVREAMLQTLRLPRTGMTVAIDIGEANDIHPKNKQEVGRRLALWALAEVYGRKGPFSGPILAGHEIMGSEVVLRFRHTDKGLVAKGNALKGFAIAGEDMRWLWAEARIDGDRVVVRHPEVKQPRAVRYGWADNPECTLYNGAGLPASPFRTDDWPAPPKKQR